jgi:hypothetical protein
MTLTYATHTAYSKIQYSSMRHKYRSTRLRHVTGPFPVSLVPALAGEVAHRVMNINRYVKTFRHGIIVAKFRVICVKITSTQEYVSVHDSNKDLEIFEESPRSFHRLFLYSQA